MPDAPTPAAQNAATKPPERPNAKPMLIRWTKPIVTMLYALVPVTMGAVYFFGLRVLAVIAIAAAAGFFFEWLFVRKQNQPVTSAIFATAALFALSLPPTIPLWIVIVGMAVATVFGKMAFGGFGHNVFNPAMVARAFIYVAFPPVMTRGWIRPFEEGFGGFTRWFGSVDALTSATPLIELKRTALDVAQETSSEVAMSLRELIVGNVAGSIGETSAILILIGAAFIYYRKAANWRITAYILGSALGLTFILHSAGVAAVPAPSFALFSGSLLFGAVFIATDPVTSARTGGGIVVYGLMLGMLVVAIRAFSAFPAAISFAVLLGNTFAPAVDNVFNGLKAKGKAKAKAEA